MPAVHAAPPDAAISAALQLVRRALAREGDAFRTAVNGDWDVMIPPKNRRACP
jgi:hypothetical protein